MIRTMTSPEILKLTQHRCTVEPSDTTVVALSLFGGVADPMGPTKHLPIALRVMSGVLGKYVITSGPTETRGELNGTNMRMVNYFSGAAHAGTRDMYGVLDVVTALYYGRNFTANTAYATLTIERGAVDKSFLSLNGTHCESGLLATAWHMRTSQEGVAKLNVDTMTGLVGKVSGVYTPGRGLACVFANRVFEARTTQPERDGAIALFPTRFAPDHDPVWSLEQTSHGTDLNRDMLARELETTAVHRVVEIDMHNSNTGLGKDEQW